MHPYPEKWVKIGRAVVYYAHSAHAFNAGTKCQHFSPKAVYIYVSHWFVLLYEVATFNSCTKCVGSSPDIIHDRTPDCYPVFWAGMHG